MSFDPKPLSPKPALRVARIICNTLETEYDVIKQTITETLNWHITESDSEDFDLTWTDTYIAPERLSKMKPYQKINHFPGMHGICKKNNLAWNLNKMQRLFPSDYNFFPKTWVLPGDYSDFKANLNKKKVFIVKPEASSQGKGIFLVRRLEEIKISERYVVQEYLQDPMLIDGLKFDLRIYVLVAGCNPLKIFIHEEGLARLATEEYSTPSAENIDDMCVHLTNYAINKNNPKFQFNRDAEKDNIGHKRSLKAFYDHVEKLGENLQELKQRIEDIIVKTLISVQPSVLHAYKCCQPEDYTNGMCFELLGFDIIIDNKMNPMLLEVNHSPSFSTDSPLDWKIKHRLIKDTLTILDLKVKDRKSYHMSMKAGNKSYFSKKAREVKENRIEKAKEIVERREKWEKTHMGGFKKLYENKETYDVYLNAATKLWSDNAGFFAKKRMEEFSKQFAGVKQPYKPKPPVITTHKRSTLSEASFKKVANPIFAAEGSEDQIIYPYDPEALRQPIKECKLITEADMKELVQYRHLEEVLKNRRHAVSLLRGSDMPKNHQRFLRLPKGKEGSSGNYILPKTFNFSPKFSNKPDPKLGFNS